MRTADGERGTLAAVAFRTFEHDPVRGHAALGTARHHEADAGDIILRQEAPEQQLQHQRRVAAAEIVHQAVALGLGEDRDDAFGIDPAVGDRGLDAGHVVGGVGGNSVDLGDGHGFPVR